MALTTRIYFDRDRAVMAKFHEVFPPPKWERAPREKRFLASNADGTVDIDVDLGEANAAVEQMRAAIGSHFRVNPRVYLGWFPSDFWE